MRKSNFALRLQPSLLEEARKLAESEGVALNQANQPGGRGEALGAPDLGLFQPTCCARETPEGAKNPQACRRRRQPADKRRRIAVE
jgi:hypothetical protein